MQFARQLLLYIALTSLLFMIIGLFRPWAMLWWEDVQNRRKVIKLYGIVALLCYGFYWALYYIARYV